MSMTKYESSVKSVPYSQAAVFAKVADLNSIERIKTLLEERKGEYTNMPIPEDKVEQVKKALETMTFDADSLTIESPMGAVTLQIIEREAPKLVKFEAVNAPIPLNMWIQLLPDTDSSCLMKVTIGAELNMFIKPMANKPLKEGVERIADVLAALPY